MQTHISRSIRFQKPCAVFPVLLVALCLLGGCGGSSSGSGSKPASTATTLSVSPSTALLGAPITLTATVTVSSGVIASGDVSITDGATSLGSPALNSSGTATLTVSNLAAGTHSIQASFAGNANQTASSSGIVSVTVTAPRATPTVAVVTAPASVLAQGYPVEFVAQVSQASGSTVPTGTVSFSNGSVPIGTAIVDASGRAITTVTTLPGGVSSITTAYSGDTNFASVTSPALATTIAAVAGTATFTNPLTLNITGGTAVSCADPATIKTQTGGANTWYLYCTSDALFAGDPATHYINVFESQDLVSWTYDGNAFAGLPSWAPNGALWAPSIKYINGLYYLYYTSPNSNQDAEGGAAIGVGTSTSPKGPFVDHGVPVVEPEPTVGDCCGGRDRSTIDPDVQQDASGQRYISFGSFDGGIFSRKLSSDGFTSDKSSEVQIAATNRYEGGFIWQHSGFWYLFASSSNCCNELLSGYSVFVGRSQSPTGPFVDADGVSMADVNAGGLEVLAMSGNKWVGPGGNVLFTDEAGQDYMLYHAISSATPVYSGSTTYTARPALIDPVEWSATGWPSVRGGFGPSALAQPAPAAQPGGVNSYVPQFQTNDAAAAAIASLSDEFNATTLSTQWSALHATPAYSFSNGTINLPTVSIDSCCQMNMLPILAEAAPATDYIVETKITMNLPVSGSGNDFAQGDLFIYGDDQNFLRLDVFSSANTRQVEFNKQATANPAYASNSGYTNLMKPSVANVAVSAYLRIAKRTIDGQATYTAYSSIDGQVWHRGGTWTHTLMNEKIGIAASNRAGFIASFDYVHVATLQ